MKNVYFLFSIMFITLIFSFEAFALCVKVPEANLRNGPSTKSEKTWKVYKYMPFKKLKKKDLWYKVEDIDGDIHWIYSKLVSDSIKCAVVNADKVNVRTGPGQKNDKTALSPVLKYYAFKVVKTKGEWVKVKDEYDNEGWIYKKLLWIQ